MADRQQDPPAAPARKFARGRGAQCIYDTLKSEILALVLAPGTPLDETALSQRFGMSRSPVREALVRLSADGLVAPLSNRSTLVAPIELAEFPRYVEALDFLQRINTRLAARHRERTALGHLRELAEAFDAAHRARDYLAMSACNRDFHVAIAEAGGNPYLCQSYAQLLDKGRRLLHLHFDYVDRGRHEELLSADHYEMVAAIEARDIERADRLAHEHTRLFHDRFLRFLRARYDDEFDFSRSDADR